MKKILLGLALLSAAVVSCDKDYAAEETRTNGISITFTSEKPSLDVDTRTGWVNGSALWLAKDKVRIACQKDGTTWVGKDASDSPRAYATAEIPANTNKAIFKLDGANTFADLTDGSFVFYSSYPYGTINKSDFSTTAKNGGILSHTIPSSQNLNADTFSAAYDVLVGKSSTLDATITAVDKNVDLTMYWKRVVAHTYLTLTNLATVGNESVSSITLTAQSGTELVGDFKYDIKNGNITETTATNEVTISNATLPVNGGSVSTWLTVLPANVTSLTVVAETDAATYTREIATCNLNFVSTSRNVLKINMASAARMGKGTDDGKKVVIDVTKLTNANTTSNITYGEYAWTDGAVSGTYFGASSNSLKYLQFNYSSTGTSNGRDRQAVFNTVAVPGNIKSIKMTTASGTNRSWTVYVGNSAMSSENYAEGVSLGAQTVTAAGTEFTVNEGAYSYFYCDYKVGSASYIGSIEVVYE